MKDERGRRGHPGEKLLSPSKKVLPRGTLDRTDTEFAALHDDKVSEERYDGFNAPFETLHGWFSNNWVVSENNDPPFRPSHKRKG